MSVDLITANKYLTSLTQACNESFSIRSNILFYQPYLFTCMIDKQHTIPFTQEWFNLANTYLLHKHTDAEKAILLSRLRYQDIPVALDATKFHMNMIARLYDQNCHKILEKRINNFKFNHAFPNRAYLTAYQTYHRKHLNGVSIAFPQLKEGKYSFEIVEKYSFDRSALVQDGIGRAKFDRKIIFPIQVSKNYSRITWEPEILAKQIRNDKTDLQLKTQIACYYDWRNFDLINRCPQLHLSLSKRMLNKQSNNQLDSFGTQSIILPLHAIPSLQFNAMCGVFENYYGNSEMLFNNWKSYKINQSVLHVTNFIELKQLLNQVFQCKSDTFFTDFPNATGNLIACL